MKKVVLKLDLHDDKAKQKAMKVVSGLSGVDSVSMDMKDKKLTVTGDIDAVVVVGKLRKICHTDIVSVGPAKEPEKKKEEPKKEEPKKPDDKKKEDPPKVVYTYPPYYNPPYYQQQYSQHPMAAQYYANARSVEEDPNGCVIS